MMRRGVGLGSLLFAAGVLNVIATACTFTVGTSELQNGDCGGGKKACPNATSGVMQCIGLDDPDYGCSQAGCGKCYQQNASTRCDPNNNCAVAVCMPGFAHCVGPPSNGCETSIYTDVGNCGLDQQSACGNVCGMFTMGKPHVNAPACVNGVCQIGGCDQGYVDCDKNIANGCECQGACTQTGACLTGGDAGVD
jgi:hypothetical protein